MDVVGVPVEIGNRPIVLPSIEHHQIEQRAYREAPPNSQIVVHLDLANRHPFEVGPHRIHLPLVNTDPTVLDERGFCVVQLR